ncbi:MAG: thermonuclease family protein [Candidatus Omnitrophica bacterium]|nr:thermonuclease family protein [Candidatus Omnitrophota bacterium]
MKNTNIVGDLDYENLLSDLKKIKEKTEKKFVKKVNKILVEGYWQMGKRLSSEGNLDDKMAASDGSVYQRLSKDLGVEYTLLTRTVKFYKLWSKKCPVDNYQELSWSHYKTLMAISDEGKRSFYLQESAKNSWNKLELSHRIKSEYFEATKARPASARANLLRGQERMYCYGGDVLKIVDGDTLVVNSDLVFGVKIEVRLRLRGINTEEMKNDDEEKARAAQLAKEFVIKQLANVERIVFQSFKVDLYGRYVADVFYLPGEKDKERIFQQGRFLNQDLLDAGLATVA